MSYSIIDSSTYLGYKRSLSVRLNKRVSEKTLHAIALKLKSLDSKNYERTFIEYYLPGMIVNNGAWATTHFNPNIEMRILGLTVEEVQRQSASPSYRAPTRSISKPVARPVDSKKWYEIGSLGGGVTVPEWKKANYEKKLSTCGAMLAVTKWKGRLNSSQDYNRLRVTSAILVLCWFSVNHTKCSKV